MMTELGETTAHREVPTNRVERPLRQRHPAHKARIMSAGLSTAAMLGIVAALGAQNPSVADVVEAPASVPNVTAVDPSAPTSVVVSELSDQPIQLTATPIVRAAQPAATQAAAVPVARTNGSR